MELDPLSCLPMVALSSANFTIQPVNLSFPHLPLLPMNAVSVSNLITWLAKSKLLVQVRAIATLCLFFLGHVYFQTRPIKIDYEHVAEVSKNAVQPHDLQYEYTSDAPMPDTNSDLTSSVVESPTSHVNADFDRE